MKKKRIKMTYEVITDFDILIDEETFKKEYKGNILKLCRFMDKEEGIQGWKDEEFKLIKAEILTPKIKMNKGLIKITKDL